jgi:NAD(P)-dependent dehydrogenase (short-subunit alcohol dehydrogenase family)
MREFEGKVAVVTGAASGIGRALAERFAQEGMKVVLADVEEDALNTAVQQLRQQEHDVIGVQTDVSNTESVEALARRTVETYGGVHILCNNAGVAAGAPSTWEYTLKDWDWVLGVNLMGVVHGLRSFVPIMLAQDEEGHIVNTASVWGLVSRGGALYGVSKFAVVRLTEGLYYDLQARDAKVKCSVLCPGAIATRIAVSARNRPSDLREEEMTPEEQAAEMAQREEVVARWQEFGMPPSEVAAIVLDGIREERFYILTHPGVLDGVRLRMEDILEGRNPRPQDMPLRLSNRPEAAPPSLA